MAKLTIDYKVNDGAWRPEKKFEVTDFVEASYVLAMDLAETADGDFALKIWRKWFAYGQTTPITVADKDGVWRFAYVR
jgi:hypothetical protein